MYMLSDELTATAAVCPGWHAALRLIVEDWQETLSQHPQLPQHCVYVPTAPPVLSTFVFSASDQNRALREVALADPTVVTCGVMGKGTQGEFLPFS